MSFISKIKDFFYDEEEIDEVEEPVKKQLSKQKKVNIYDIEKEKNKKEDKKQNEISERELFKAERTFNFPINVDDESDFEPADGINNLNRVNNKERDVENTLNNVPKTVRSNSSSMPNYTSPVTTNYGYTKSDTLYHKKEDKKFKPTPIISPIYGILNKNYEKEDLEIKKTDDLEIEKKVDFDSVRKKAYGEIEEKKETHKSLFYNLDEEDVTDTPIEEDKKLEKELKDDFEEKPYKKDEVIITYEQVPDKEEDSEEMEIPKLSRTKKHKKKSTEEKKESSKETTDDNILDDTKEQDLFNLIDNMYNDEEEEEDDE